MLWLRTCHGEAAGNLFGVKCGIKMLREVAISSPGRAGTAGEKGLFKRPG